MENFYADVIRRDSRFNSPERISDPALLEPVTRRKVGAILRDALAHGVQFCIYETYRSQDRQQRLFEEGVSRLRFVGVHHFGLACDIVFLHAGEPDWKGDFSLLGNLAKAHGLIWGGDWGHPARPTSFPDFDHVQRCTLSEQAALFRGEWYPRKEEE